MDTSYKKYLEEKALLEAYGHTSVITYEEWKKIKAETVETFKNCLKDWGYNVELEKD